MEKKIQMQIHVSLQGVEPSGQVGVRSEQASTSPALHLYRSGN